MSQWWATLQAMASVCPHDEDVRELSWASPSRYYVARIQTNLFGDLELLRAWGGIGSRRGGHKAEPLDSLLDGQQRLRQEARRRERRGYALQSVAWPHSQAL